MCRIINNVPQEEERVSRLGFVNKKTNIVNNGIWREMRHGLHAPKLLKIDGYNVD
jgi:hypothetical protein